MARYFKRVPGTRAAGHWTNLMFLSTSCHTYNGIARLESVSYSSWSRWKGKYNKTDCSFSMKHDDFWEEVRYKALKRGKLVIVGYDIGNSLALCNFWEMIEDAVFKWEGGAINTPPFIINVTYQKRIITFIDVLNYYDESLEDIVSRAMQVKPMTSEYQGMLGKQQADLERELQSVETVIFEMIKMHDEKGWGEVKVTGPACAYNVFRHKYYDTQYYTHDNICALQLERQAYYGGRCQIFRIESLFEPVYYLDVNSAYPYVMKESFMPIKLACYYESISIEKLRELSWHYIACAFVCVKTDEYSYPVKKEGKTIYATGEFWTYLCGDELKRALLYGHVKYVANAAIYERGNLFSRYVDDLYSEKLAAQLSGNKSAEGTAKMMLNSLYGKFAQKTPLWIDVKKIVAPKAWGHYWEDMPDCEEKVAARSIAWNVQIQDDQKEKDHSSPIISAAITSALRVHMWNLMAICGFDNLFYTDTDSIHCNHDGLLRLNDSGWMDDTKLGYLKVKDEYSAVQYFGPKRYVADDVVVFAGLKKNARKGGQNNWQFDILERTPSIIARRPDGTVRYWPKSVSMEEPAFPGTLLEDGRLLAPVLS